MGLQSFNRLKLSLVIKENSKGAVYTIIQVKTGKNTGRKTDRASVSGPGINLCRKALIQFYPLIRADADIHNNLLHEA